MELVDTPATPAFDASAFTTYDNEVDSTPTERELVEELPAHLMPPPIDTENIKPTFRRGTGYLRAETTPDEAKEQESTETHAFGAGLEPAEAAVETPAVQQAESGSANNEAADKSERAVTDGEKTKSGGRKRRRRRKRKSRDTNAANSTESMSNESTEENLTASAVSPPATSESTETNPNDDTPDAAEPASSDAESGETADSSDTPKRKRRRRRRRGK